MARATAPPTADRFLDAKEVARMLSCSVKTVYQWCALNVIPQPRKVGRRASRWSQNELMASLERCPVKFRKGRKAPHPAA
jgi:predicted DNA-binding transcriptional regulator AlpA